MYNKYDEAVAEVKARRSMRAGKKTKKKAADNSPMRSAMEKGVQKAMGMIK
jgi:hypothetical protein